MSMKITVPWQIRMPAMKSKSPRSRNWRNRQHYNEDTLSTPMRSVTMEKDDLDHLGAMHQTIASPSKPRRLLQRFLRSRS